MALLKEELIEVKANYAHQESIVSRRYWGWLICITYYYYEISGSIAKFLQYESSKSVNVCYILFPETKEIGSEDSDVPCLYIILILYFI